MRIGFIFDRGSYRCILLDILCICSFFFSPLFGFAYGQIFLFSSLSRKLLCSYSGQRELRVLNTGYFKTLPVTLGQICPLSADLYGAIVHVNKFRLPFFFLLRRYSGHGKKMITLITVSKMLMFEQARYSG